MNGLRLLTYKLMKMKNAAGISVLLWLIVIVGWIMNIVSVISLALSDVPITSLFILKIVGIFIVPLGSILGYFF